MEVAAGILCATCLGFGLVSTESPVRSFWLCDRKNKETTFVSLYELNQFRKKRQTFLPRSEFKSKPVTFRSKSANNTKKLAARIGGWKLTEGLHQEHKMESPTDDTPSTLNLAVSPPTPTGEISPTSPAIADNTSPNGSRARVLYDFQKANDTEINLVEGQHITVIEGLDSDWCLGRNENDNIGWFPSSYITVIEDAQNSVELPVPVSPSSTVNMASEPPATDIVAMVFRSDDRSDSPPVQDETDSEWDLVSVNSGIDSYDVLESDDII